MTNHTLTTLRSRAQDLAERLAALGYNDYAKALRGARKPATLGAAAKAAKDAIYTFDSSLVATLDAMESDLETFIAECGA